jgi:malonyl-CoA O-methyltransferase
LQAQVARQLVQNAIRRSPQPPQDVFDLGCGTGLVAEMVARRWPEARITAVDNAPVMLERARRKIPHLRVIADDIASCSFTSAFDLAFSSMALHWLPKPRTALENWMKGLKPRGCLFAALLTEGSFEEWRSLCAAENLDDGLWPLPRADFADGFMTEMQTLRVDYPSAKDFLYRLKATGASTPRPGHRPFKPAILRNLLAGAPVPFTVTYRVLYIEAPSPESI